MDFLTETVKKRGRQLAKIYDYWEKANFAYSKVAITLDSGPATKWLKKLRDYLNREFPEKTKKENSNGNTKSNED